MTHRLFQYASDMQDDLRRIRRHLHAHPELSFQEFATCAFVQQELGKLGIDFEVVAETGVVGTIQGTASEEGPIIGLRADMDALPIAEQNEVPYVSTAAGVMHACGHDVHTTWLLGAARLLNELRSEWSGTVRLFFQPGEELNPGGASKMIQHGVLDTYRPDRMFALHVIPELEVGKIAFGAGPVMASVDDIFITIRGPGGHAAAPHETVDTVLLAAEVISGLQKIISRHKPPFSPSVLSICSIHGGDATNVIPANVSLAGTFRCMDETWRDKALGLVHSFVGGIGHGTGAVVTCRIDKGYPTVINDTVATSHAFDRLQKIFPEEALVGMPESLGGEDFAYFAQQVPASFLRVGTGNITQGFSYPLHTPRFDIDEAALPIGVAVLAGMVMPV